MKSFSCSCLVGCPFVSDGDLDLRRDLDQDGVDALWDCDDQDPEVGERKSVYMDEDGDGYGSNKETTNCDPDVTFAWNDNDCDDGDPEIHPRA